MELMHNGCKVINRKLPIKNNMTKLFFENQKWFKNKDCDLEKFAFKQREIFISILNHDLKVPTLAQIRALELLLDESEGYINNSQKEIINLTLESCRYMYEMLSAIVAVYKYENNDIILYFENTDILRLIDGCCAKNEMCLKNKNIKVIINAKEKFLTIPADKIQIKNAFDNIIDYIVANTCENSNILCSLNKEGEKIKISISFESPYISAEIMNNMFNMYVTQSEKLDKVGNGVGLYLAKHIIKAHNGNIYAKDGQNICCVIELPCVNEC